MSHYTAYFVGGVVDGRKEEVDLQYRVRRFLKLRDVQPTNPSDPILVDEIEYRRLDSFDNSVLYVPAEWGDAQAMGFLLERYVTLAANK